MYTKHTSVSVLGIKSSAMPISAIRCHTLWHCVAHSTQYTLFSILWLPLLTCSSWSARDVICLDIRI